MDLMIKAEQMVNSRRTLGTELLILMLILDLIDLVIHLIIILLKMIKIIKMICIRSYDSHANNQAVISGGILVGLSVQQLGSALAAIIGAAGTYQQIKQSMDRQYSAALDSLTMSSASTL